jgi:3-mercaptopyruvate sulfurtransferase SseA
VALQLKRHGITRVRPLLGGLGLWMDSRYPIQELSGLTPMREPGA